MKGICMAESVAKQLFPKLFLKVEKSRSTAQSRPLSMTEINTLLSMRFSNKPVFESIEQFYSQEYKTARESGLSSIELEKIVKFRPATSAEANLLYNDIHFREEKTS
jgi:hypothetical protein